MDRAEDTSIVQLTLFNAPEHVVVPEKVAAVPEKVAHLVPSPTEDSYGLKLPAVQSYPSQMDSKWQKTINVIDSNEQFTS